jgi:hypothetical protein
MCKFFNLIKAFDWLHGKVIYLKSQITAEISVQTFFIFHFIDIKLICQVCSAAQMIANFRFFLNTGNFNSKLFPLMLPKQFTLI